MEPPISALTPDWSDVLERAQMMRPRLDSPPPTDTVRRVSLTRGLLLAAAITAVGVGAAGAAHLLSSGGPLFGRHYPVNRHVAHVRYRARTRPS